MNPTALVTGASAGIGQAIAEELASRQFDLVLVARRLPRLTELAEALTAQHGVQVTVLVADLAEPGAPAALAGQLAERELAVDWLVNNAGYGVAGSYLGNDWSVHQRFLQVMVNAVAELTWRLLPGMKQRGQGRVVNIASLAGLIPPTAGHTLYGAVKSWMIFFSQSLDAETRPHGVRVTAVCPGFTLSEFHDVSGLREQVNQLPSALWMDAATVARQAVDAAQAGRPVYINGRINRTLALLARLLPRRAFLWLSSGQSSKFRSTR